MQRLPRELASAAVAALDAERCCSLHASHVATTGCGALFADRWPSPRALAGFTGGNLGLSGTPDAVPDGALRTLLAELRGGWERVFVDPGQHFAARVRAEVAGLYAWPRVAYVLDGPLRRPGTPAGVEIRALDVADADALARIDASIGWIHDTHGGAAALAASGRAVAAFDGGRIVSVAAVFYAGSRFDELGVVTDPGARASGLSTACSAALIERTVAAGRIACWSTTPDNLASRRVAEKLGMRKFAEPMHLLCGSPITGARPLD